MRGGEGEMSDADALDTVQLTQRLDAEVVAGRAPCARPATIWRAIELGRNWGHR